MLNQQPNLLAHAVPIATGRGDDAMARKAAGITGDALTTQYVKGTAAAVAPQIVIAPAVAPVANTDVLPPVPNETVAVNVQAERNEYKDAEQSMTVRLTDAVELNVTLCTMYDHSLSLDFSVLPDTVVCSYINFKGEIIAATTLPTFDEVLDDFVLDSGQYMVLGTVPATTQHTHSLTLTKREEVAVAAPVNQLIDVNATIKPTPEEDKPYYFAWGEKRRNKERSRLRKTGREVPVDL